jgi:hypothetical protein
MFLTLAIATGFVVACDWAAAQEERGRRQRDRAAEATADDEGGYSITIVGDVDAEMAAVAGEMTQCFYQCYPKLVADFDNPDKPASKHIVLRFQRPLRVPAYCSGSQITVSIDWLREHPEDIGMLTHELTHAVQQYPRGAPGWLTEGIADYTRKVYGPAEQPGWALPEKLTSRNNWTDSYRVSARFLEWVEGKHPGTVKAIHQKLQAGQYQDSDFETATGTPLDTLWRDCLRDMQDAAVKEAE